MFFQEQNNCLKGGRGVGGGQKEEVLREEPLKHMKENRGNSELEGGKGKRRWKCWGRVGGDIHLHFVIRKWGEGGGVQWPSFLL